MCLWNLSRFATYFPYKILCFLAFMECPCEILCFMSCCVGPLRALRMRFHACLTGVRSLDEIACFLAAEFCFWWFDVRTVESWMLKEVGDWVYTMVYWTLRCDFVNVSFVVAVGVNASALGDRKVWVSGVMYVIWTMCALLWAVWSGRWLWT